MGMFRRWEWVIAVVMVTLFPAATLWAQMPLVQTPRNVILFIGDGMGSNQITATRISRVGPDGRLVFDLFRYVGLMTTHSADKLVTDSAAAGTSLASGVKTDNGMIGQLPDGTSVVTIAELAQRHGKRVGIVSDVPVTHATPASFLAHHPKRSEQDRIAEQIVVGGMDLVMGGGLRYFLPQGIQGSERRDSRDLRAEARHAGFRYFESLGTWAADGEGRVLCLMGLNDLPETGSPTLAEMLEHAVRFLDRGDGGFFLMLEAGRIDWRSHDNDLTGTMAQVMAFDAAIRQAIAMTGEETLIVVTADHETGGLQIRGGAVGNPEALYHTGGHTGDMVPVYAMGPGAARFTGVLDNTDIPRKIWEAWGLPASDLAVRR